MTKVDPATTWLTNLRWSLRDVDDIDAMLRAGWDRSSIAEAFMTTREEIDAFLDRNGMRGLLRERRA